MYWYKNLPDQHIYDDLKKRDNPSAKLQRTFIEFIILSFLVALAYFLFSGFSYVDFRDQCFLKIKYDVLKGDRASIVDGLKRLKKEDYVFYRKFCANVSEIYERRCVEANDNSSNIDFIQSDGCYVKGSHAILIKPMDERYSNKTDMRVEDIRKYGQMAINYWENEAPALFSEE